MPLFALGFLVIVAAATMGSLKLWYDISELRREIRQLRDTQDALIDMVSTTMLEDDALSREILSLKATRRSPQ